MLGRVFPSSRDVFPQVQDFTSAHDTRCTEFITSKHCTYSVLYMNQRVSGGSGQDLNRDSCPRRTKDSLIKMSSECLYLLLHISAQKQAFQIHIPPQGNSKPKPWPRNPLLPPQTPCRGKNSTKRPITPISSWTECGTALLVAIKGNYKSQQVFCISFWNALILILM